MSQAGSRSTQGSEMTDDFFPIPAVKWPPKPYMKRAVKFLLEHQCAALFLDPGLSKTAITLAALLVLKKAGLLGKVLVVAPLRVCYSTWPGELAKWLDFHKLTHVVLHGPKKEKLLDGLLPNQQTSPTPTVGNSAAAQLKPPMRSLTGSVRRSSPARNSGTSATGGPNGR